MSKVSACFASFTPNLTKWVLPDDNFVKVNFDAMVKSGVDSGLGAVIRDNNGHILVVGVRKANKLWSVEMCEAAVALFGMELARDRGYKFVHLEGDELSVIRCILESKKGAALIFLFYEHISSIKELFTSFLCTHMYKGGNTVAHNVASWHVENATEYVCSSGFPQSLLTLASSDLS
ncbi:unnamed protein product [Amaranthus hypochondriacus]